MKNNLKIAGILGSIALVCALLIASVNMLTSKIITDNAAKTELETIQLIFEDYDEASSNELEVSDTTYIEKKIEAKNSNNQVLGYLYTATGTNAYGSISLMIAIENNKLKQLEFLSNTQSFASTVASHVASNYPCSAENVLYLGVQPEEVEQVGELSLDDVASIDTSCGATYGADLVKTLVLACLNDNRG